MRRTRGVLGAALGAAALGLLTPAAAGAAIFAVDRADDPMAGGTACSPVTANDCSLRGAVSAANTAPLSDEITIDQAVTPTVTLSLAGSEDNNASGDLDVTEDLTITGTGNPIIDQAAADRVLHAPNAIASVTLSGLTVNGGAVTSGTPNGGNIWFQAGPGETLTLDDVDVLNGVASNNGGNGGGIAADSGGSVVIQNGSLVQGNDAGGGPGAQSLGGGVYVANVGPGSLTVSNSEISANDVARGLGAGTGFGGGIFFDSATGVLDLNEARVVSNRSGGGGNLSSANAGGIQIQGGGTLTATGGSISSNEAGGGAGGTGDSGVADGFGGGLHVETDVAGVTLDSVQVVGNRAGGNGGRANGFGGGISASAPLTLQNGTVVRQNLAGVDAVLDPNPGPPSDLTGTGGGIAFNGEMNEDLIVDDSAVGLNQAGENIGEGGGLWITALGTNSSFEVTDSVVSENVAGSTAGDPAAGIGLGGGIYRLGEADSIDTIERSTIDGNTAAGATDANGGGVDSQTGGTLAIDDSTISNNTATSGTAPFIGLGGGLTLDNLFGTDPEYVLVNSTITGNTATSAAGQGGDGGGVAIGLSSSTRPDVAFRHVTIARNTADSDGPGGNGGNVVTSNFATGGNEITFRASIIAEGSGDTGVANCSADADAIGSLGENVMFPGPLTACQMDGSGDQVGDPLLGLLAANGGPTETMALQAGSAAVDSAPDDAMCPDTDQRGVARPVGALCDAGAFEGELAAPGGGASTPLLPAPTVDPCPELRERLKRARKKLKAARKADRPTKKKRAKIRKIRRLLAENNC